MGRITEALKKVSDERVTRIQRKPRTEYVVRKIEGTDIDQHVVSYHDPASPIGEQYKILRTNIQSLKENKGVRSFVITSSIDGEGKTITALNLAITMAHDLNDKSILLIDADLRKGKASRYLGLGSHAGLSEFLTNGAMAENMLVRPDIPNLTVLMAGKAPKNPSELLSSKKMQRLIADFKGRFDYIFIDTPPVMPLTDACLIGAMVDGVLLVIQAGRTQRDMVKNTETRLYQARAKTLGYILTNMEGYLPGYLHRYINKYDNYYTYYGQRKESEVKK